MHDDSKPSLYFIRLFLQLDRKPMLKLAWLAHIRSLFNISDFTSISKGAKFHLN